MTRHHYVPQMYLRRFADGDKRVVLVDRDDLSQSVVKTTKQALQLDDFYGWDTGLSADEVEDPKMLDPEYVEDLLSVYESRATPAFTRLIETGLPPTTLKDRYHLANFIALQVARGPRFREDLSQTATLTMRKYMLANTDPARVREFLVERGKPHEAADVDAFIRRAYGPDGPTLVPDQAIAIQQALGFAMKQVVRSLWGRDWMVRTYDEPCLLTSDEPVVAFHPDDEPVTAVTAPFVFLAVDRRHLLVMREAGPDTEPNPDVVPNGPAAAASQTGGPEVATNFNSLVATQADKYIVHHPDDAALLADLVVGPRTEWREEILETVRDGDEVTVRSRIRRLPAG